MSHSNAAPCAVAALREAVANLNAAVCARDYDAIAKNDHQLRNAAMAAVGGLPLSQQKIDETEVVLVEAIDAVRGAAKYLEDQRLREAATLSKQEHVRLVYSQKGTS